MVNMRYHYRYAFLISNLHNERDTTGDVGDLHFISDTLDKVVSISVIEHIYRQ